MPRLILLNLILLMILLSCIKDAQIPVEKISVIEDDFGNEFVIDSIPNKVVTLAPNLTEMVFDLGKGSSIIGNTLYCNYPDSANGIYKVGDLLTTNYEKILELKPDLIFITVEGNTKGTYERLRKLGFRVFVSNPRNFNGIKKTYLDMGRIFGVEILAQQQIENWNKRIAKIKNQTPTPDQKTVMFMIDLRPIMLAGKSTYVNEIISICGLKNIAADSEVNYPVFSREEILLRNPDYIIFTRGRVIELNEIKQAYPEWKNLSAVKNEKIIFIDGDLYFRPGPRFVLAVEDLNSKLLKN